MEAETTEDRTKRLERVLTEARKAQKAGKDAEATRAYRQIKAEARDTDLARDADAFLLQSRSEGDPNYVSLIAGIVLLVGSVVLTIMGLIAFHSDGANRRFLASNWGWVLLSAGALIAALIVARKIDHPVLKLSWSRQNFILSFGSIFFMMFLTGLTVFLGAAHRMFVYEILFILTACILPAATYYLFLKSRRPSILNEFIGNLGRLGLLRRRQLFAAPVETVDAAGDAVTLSFRRTADHPRENGADDPDFETRMERKMRVNGYFQRFEALYGQLRFSDESGEEQDRDEFVDKLLGSVDHLHSEEEVVMPVATVYLADIFRANLVIPLGLATVLSLIGWFLVVDPQIDPGPGAVPAFLHIKAVSTPLNFAFLGAYFFGVQMLFRRFVRRDLGPNAYLAFATRIILAVVGVWVVVLCFPEGMRPATIDAEIWTNALLVVAFTVGVFPKLLWSYIKAFFAFVGRARYLLPNFGSEQPLSQLDGLTIWHEVRLEEEDIENVPNMATVDIVDLMLRTQTPAERLMSWVDQSILHCALGPGNSDPNSPGTAAARLRVLGIRSATQFAAGTRPGSVERAAVEKVLGGDPAPLPSLTCAMGLEPNFHLMRHWRGI